MLVLQFRSHANSICFIKTIKLGNILLFNLLIVHNEAMFLEVVANIFQQVGGSYITDMFLWSTVMNGLSQITLSNDSIN